MKKRNNFGKAFLLGTALVLMARYAYAEDVVFVDESLLESDLFLADTFEDNSDCWETAEEPCDEDTEFIQIVENDDSLDEVVSLSRPAGYQTTSVRESMRQEEMIDDTFIPFETEESVETAVKTTQNISSKNIIEETETADIIDETISQDSDNLAGKENTSGQEEAFVMIPGNKIPLKKVTTTITETTTKIQKSQTDDHIKTGDTLNEKLAYGTSVHDWDAYAGTTLRELLLDWGEKSGWTVVWKLDRDYHLEAGVIFRGTFTDVSAALIRSFARATPAPIGTFYQGNRFLVINKVEDENER